MQNRKWLSFIIALLVSLGLWVYVVTVENPEDDQTLHNIPVEFSGVDVLREDYGLIITDDNVGSGVSVTFYGKRTDLNKLLENRSTLAVTIDVTRNVRSAQDYSFYYDISNISLPSSVSTSSVSLTASSPSSIDITVEQLKKVPIPVKIINSSEAAEGYMFKQPTMDYEEIVIEGPADEVDQVSYALVSLKRENVDKTIVTSLDYTLMSEAGEVVNSTEITSDVTQIQVTLPVFMYKDVPLEVGVIEGGGATENDVVIDIDPPTVRLSGDASVLDGISSLKLSNIDLASLQTNDETVTKTILIPEGCTVESGEQEATVRVRMPNKDITMLRIPNTNIQYTNVPEGILPEAKTNVIPVTIRANATDIKSIAVENIRVVADLSGVTVQESTSITVPVTIYVDGIEGAGVIGAYGAYSIVVDLSVATDGEDVD